MIQEQGAQEVQEGWVNLELKSEYEMWLNIFLNSGLRTSQYFVSSILDSVPQFCTKKEKPS